MKKNQGKPEKGGKEISRVSRRSLWTAAILAAASVYRQTGFSAVCRHATPSAGSSRLATTSGCHRWVTRTRNRLAHANFDSNKQCIYIYIYIYIYTFICITHLFARLVLHSRFVAELEQRCMHSTAVYLYAHAVIDSRGILVSQAVPRSCARGQPATVSTHCT